jgi:hypothetical protein
MFTMFMMFTRWCDLESTNPSRAPKPFALSIRCPFKYRSCDVSVADCLSCAHSHAQLPEHTFEIIVDARLGIVHASSHSARQGTSGTCDGGHREDTQILWAVVTVLNDRLIALPDMPFPLCRVLLCLDALEYLHDVRQTGNTPVLLHSKPQSWRGECLRLLVVSYCGMLVSTCP